MSVDVAQVKSAAAGRWIEIYSHAGLSSDVLDGKEHPCPQCKGNTRFRAMHDFTETGAIFCRICEAPGGDGFKGLQWLGKAKDFNEALRIVADKLSIQLDSGTVRKRDIIEEICRDKRMPIGAFRRFEPKPATRGKRKVVRVPVWSEEGERFSHFDLTPGEKGLFKRGQGNAGLFFPGRPPQPGETWLLTEGVKDAAALTGLGYLACGINTCFMAAKYARLFAGCNVVLVPDLDRAAEQGSDKTASHLSGIAENVRTVRLPGELLVSNGGDVRDVLKRPDGEQLVRQAVDDAREWKPTKQGTVDADSRIPEIEVVEAEWRTTSQVLTALANVGWESPWLTSRETNVAKIFQRSGKLVHITADPMPKKAGVTTPPSTPRIADLPPALLRERIVQSCRLFTMEVRKDALEKVIHKPPGWLVGAIHERGQYPSSIKPISGIIRCPSLRSDGTVIEKPGYDADSQLMYLPSADYPAIPHNPTHDDARTAAEKLFDIVCDFPFKDGSHKSAWLSLLLTMVARPAVNGPCPLFLIDATTRGSGKTKLCDVASMIAYGSVAARNNMPRTDEERRKVITAVVLAGLPAVLFDNIAGELGGACLDAALTGTVWRDRVLGSSETTGDLPLTQIWMATGNNVALGADTARRTMYCRLESPLENPEDRSNFKHKDLLGWVKRNRAAIAAAAVTVMKAWFQAAQPKIADGTWGSFESWNDTVRQAIVWCGLPDPLETKQVVREADRSAELLGLIHDAFDEVAPDGTPITSSEVATLIASSDDLPALRTAVAELTHNPTAQKIGSALRSFKGRIRQGRFLEQDTKNSKRPWRLVCAHATHSALISSPYAREGSKTTQGKRGVISSPIYKERGTSALSVPSAQPSCDHTDTAIDSKRNIVRDGRVHCRACDKYIGRVPAEVSR